MHTKQKDIYFKIINLPMSSYCAVKILIISAVENVVITGAWCVK